MGKLNVHHGQHNGISKPPVHHHHGKKDKGVGKGIKVVYISSPMKLTASAEEFRAVVQELTGRDSNFADHDAPGVVPSYYSSSYSSFGRASHTAGATAAPGARALPLAMASTADYVVGASAMPQLYQSMLDQTGATALLYGQDFW